MPSTNMSVTTNSVSLVIPSDVVLSVNSSKSFLVNVIKCMSTLNKKKNIHCYIFFDIKAIYIQNVEIENNSLDFKQRSDTSVSI